jgi:hypothetical protein
MRRSRRALQAQLRPGSVASWNDSTRALLEHDADRFVYQALSTISLTLVKSYILILMTVGGSLWFMFDLHGRMRAPEQG